MSPQTLAALSALVEALANERGAAGQEQPHEERPRYVTSKTCGALFGGKTWRSIDEWAGRRGIERLSIAGSPAYRTADLDAAIEATATKPVAGDDGGDDDYERLARGLGRAA